jgi:hypothetical protein
MDRFLPPRNRGFFASSTLKLATCPSNAWKKTLEILAKQIKATELSFGIREFDVC